MHARSLTHSQKSVAIHLDTTHTRTGEFIAGASIFNMAHLSMLMATIGAKGFHEMIHKSELSIRSSQWCKLLILSMQIARVEG